MTVYTSSAASPIANDGGGKFYATYFFVNGPYNPNLQTLRQHLGAFDDTVLPSVPLWRSERSQQHQQHHDAVPVKIGLNPRGRGISLPLFSGGNERGIMKYQLSICILLVTAATAAAQVASHAPTGMGTSASGFAGITHCRSATSRWHE